MSAFDHSVNDYRDGRLRFQLSPTFWVNTDEINEFFANKNIEHIKFFNDDCTEINNAIQSLPNDAGGIYFFILKNDILPNLSSHILYIGRARYTNKQNLRKRCREYFSVYYKEETKRQHIYRMLKTWGSCLHLHYLPLNDNDEIDHFEKLLLNNIQPPCNIDIPCTKIKRIKQSISAF